MADAGTRPLRVRQAADLLGVSPATVRRWADSGRIVSRRTQGGERRFHAEDLRLRPAAGEAASSPAHADAERRYQLLLDTSVELGSSLDLDDVLQSAARRLGSALDIPDCDFYRLEGDDRLVCVASSTKGRFDGAWTGREFSLRDWGSARTAIQERRAVAYDSVVDDPRLSRARAPVGARLRPAQLHRPAAHRQGRGDRHHRAARPPRAPLHGGGDRVAEAVAKLVALAVERARLYDEVKRLHLANLRALSSALSAKDYYTLGHASRVAGYAALLGRELGWDDERLVELQNVAFLHDIGKIGVSDRVLLKAGPLTSEEWELVRQHPGISAEIARPLFREELVAGVRHHHERFDGGGYPDGLAGADIPEVARVLCVVDCYDAMSSERPYRHALSYRQCLAELRRLAGSQFDPDVTPAFLKALRRLRRRRAEVDALAAQAAALIDPAAHCLLRTRADEARPEYAEMVSALRAFRDENPPVRFVTSFAIADEHCISVLDTGDDESDVSHVGDHWLAQDVLAAVLAGGRSTANVLNADDFGVWVTGTAPLCARDGTALGAVTVDVPALEWAPSLQSDQSHTLAAIIRAATIRFSRAEVEAITDGLTGLYNHRYLHERLEEELERARRYDDVVSLLFIDCDEFKQFNDAYGHKLGDTALSRIARILESCSRRVDLAARYGGEEFVLVLVGTDGAGARTAAERIRAEVEATGLAGGQPLTVSIGIASYPEDALHKDELLDKADWAMYAAKRAGRDRVLSFQDELVKRDWVARSGGRAPARRRDR